MKLELGPTGKVSKGNVLDVNKDKLEKRLQQYEPRLYLKWNPDKNRGYGIWELRIRPEKKSVTGRFPYMGTTYTLIEYKENDFENHIFDTESLGYHVYDRMVQADMWAACNYDKQQHHRLNEYLRKVDNQASMKKYEEKEKARQEMQYALMQDKKIIEDFQERIQSGVNPAHLMRFWK